MMQMNNPVVLLANAMRSGGNAGALLQQMIAQNPRMRQAASMIQGKSQQQLQQMVINMCRERGTTPEDVARSLGIQIPSQR